MFTKKNALLTKLSKTECHNSPREGRPNFVVTEDSVCQVKTLVLEDRRVTVKQLAAITKISLGSIETILHDHLHMSKVSARWVPRLLTPNQKEQRAKGTKRIEGCHYRYKAHRRVSLKL